MIDTLVISGGGLKGFCMISSINQLFINNIINFKNIKNYYGTSVGSLLCSLLAIGYTLDEIMVFIDKFDFEKISDEIDIDNLFNNYGVFSGNNIILVLETLFEEKINNKNITFKQLYELNNVNLNIIATNVTDGVEEVFNYNNSPNLNIMLAIRMSIAVPIIFTPVLYNNKLYVDGALTNNFPINHVKNNNFIGITTNFKKTLDNPTLLNYIYNCVIIPIQSINLKNITRQNVDNIIFIEDNNIKTGNFGLNKENKDNLMEIGRLSAINYINKNNYLINKIKFINFLVENISFICESFFLLY